jgi:phosphoenolpyruvate synthase/pyruvate phosphate dikinase
MTKIGLPVPPGFTIVTSACVHYSKTKKHPVGLDDEILTAIKRLERETGKLFGKAGKNGMLLLSVRSGAAFSMPGMVSKKITTRTIVFQNSRYQKDGHGFESRFERSVGC